MSETTRVLIVDDEERILLLLEVTLRAAGYEVLVAHDGQEAINRLEQEKVDAVITDMNMPQVGGLEVIGAVRRLYGAKVPVIVVTAYGSVQNAVDAMHRGATDYLEKPFDMADLKACLAKWLEEAGKI
ncbi:MAG: response regulator [Candidatus Omnitrophica bacterium]|nr:response regulator [bacterium]MCL4735095.1 response regulator [Candidatus Omnitrophota bacterium]NUP93243.1 response regulator [Candidatus Omnitrophota bacterium]